MRLVMLSNPNRHPHRVPQGCSLVAQSSIVIRCLPFLWGVVGCSSILTYCGSWWQYVVVAICRVRDNGIGGLCRSSPVFWGDNTIWDNGFGRLCRSPLWDIGVAASLEGRGRCAGIRLALQNNKSAITPNIRHLYTIQ